MLRAVAMGFRGGDDSSVREPFAQRYFDELLSFWEKRELDLGISFSGAMYPRTYTQDVITRTDELLAGDLPQPVRRLLIEGKDDTQRVLRARAADTA